MMDLELLGPSPGSFKIHLDRCSKRRGLARPFFVGRLKLVVESILRLVPSPTELMTSLDYFGTLHLTLVPEISLYHVVEWCPSS